MAEKCSLNYVTSCARVRNCLVHVFRKACIYRYISTLLQALCLGGGRVGWLYWVNGPLRQYFSLYRTLSQREGNRGEKG